jgi:hypothetical protein
LQHGRPLRHLLGGLGELLRRLELGVGVDDPRPALAVGLRCRAIERFIVSGSETPLISTRSMVTPHSTAGLSNINSSPWLSFSRPESRSSSSLLPVMDLSEVRAICETANP